MTDSLDDIWEGDLLNRREDALLLEAYIHSLATRRFHRDGAKSFVIAVDAPYGIGKSFFLKRLTRQLSINHAVAYVDAWADDLADDPLTALISTLHDAVMVAGVSPEVKSRFNKVVVKAGKIAQAVAWGAAKKAISFAIGGIAVDQVIDIAGDGIGESDTFLSDGTKETSIAIVDAISKASQTKNLMGEKLANFEKSKNFIKELKRNLTELASSVFLEGKSCPIIIIIDELDRCRPTYAINLLEQIKHIFDVPNFVFILGTNIDQLTHTISNVYGGSFDGASYLHRFINRKFMLKKSSTEDLCKYLLQISSVNSSSYYQLKFINNEEIVDVEFHKIIAMYCDLYDISAREIFDVFDILETCQGISGSNKLLLNYLLPMAISIIKGFDLYNHEPTGPSFKLYTQQNDSVIFTESAREVVVKCQNYAGLLWGDERNLRVHEERGEQIALLMAGLVRNLGADERGLAHPFRYKDLLQSVGRFRSGDGG